MAKKKTPKATVKKGHRIARAIKRSRSSGARDPWAVGMAQAKKSAAKRKRKKR
jgi:hypothetical protein